MDSGGANFTENFSGRFKLQPYHKPKMSNCPAGFVLRGEASKGSSLPTASSSVSCTSCHVLAGACKRLRVCQSSTAAVTVSEVAMRGSICSNNRHCASSAHRIPTPASTRSALGTRCAVQAQSQRSESWGAIAPATCLYRLPCHTFMLHPLLHFRFEILVGHFQPNHATLHWKIQRFCLKNPSCSHVFILSYFV